MMTAASPFRIDPRIDLSAMAARFALTGRIQIPQFLLPEGTALLQQSLLARDDWQHVISADATIYEIPAQDFDALPAAHRHMVRDALHSEATASFRFQYDVIRVPDGEQQRASQDTQLTHFARFMASTDTLAFFHRLTGQAEVRFADAQATRYRAGDFLTRHDNDVAGKGRRLAYVLGLSADWRPEWGGLLLFTDSHGQIVDAMAPQFNALCLFSVPQPHSVTYVAPYAGSERLSVTGWLRTGPDR